MSVVSPVGRQSQCRSSIVLQKVEPYFPPEAAQQEVQRVNEMMNSFSPAGKTRDLVDWSVN